MKKGQRTEKGRRDKSQKGPCRRDMGSLIFSVAVIFSALVLASRPLTVRASGANGRETQQEETAENTIYGLDGEELEAFLDFVKEKLGVTEPEEEEGLREALKSGSDAGSGLAESFEELYEEYQQKLADGVQKAVREQVAEPAAEAAKTALEDTAKTFWQDLKDSVAAFLKGIFAAIRGD